MHDDIELPFRDPVLRWLQAGPHACVLTVGQRAKALLEPGPGTAVSARADFIDTPTAPVLRWLQRLDGGPRYDAALVCLAGTDIAQADTAIVLGRLRDLHASRLLLLAETGDGLRDDLLSLGMERLPLAAGETAGATLYAFDLNSYKRTPDWLNARHWANPENWDRYRW